MPISLQKSRVFVIIIQLLTAIIDFFHRFFERWIAKQTFRYIACGGGNTVLNWLLYTLSYYYVFHGSYYVSTVKYSYCKCTHYLYAHGYYYVHKVKYGSDIVNLVGGVHVTPRQAAYAVAFSISFPIGFLLSRYIVFPESNIKSGVQFFRYGLATATFVVLTIVLIRVFAWMLPFVRAEISYVFIMIITAVLSYLSQKFFTFKQVDAA